MSKHIDIKHEVQKCNRTTFKSVLDEAMLSENERRMMEMFYIEKKSIDYIADTMGYSKAGILKMHKRILTNIESLL